MKDWTTGELLTEGPSLLIDPFRGDPAPHGLRDQSERHNYWALFFHEANVCVLIVFVCLHKPPHCFF